MQMINARRKESEKDGSNGGRMASWSKTKDGESEAGKGEEVSEQWDQNRGTASAGGKRQRENTFSQHSIEMLR